MLAIAGSISEHMVVVIAVKCVGTDVDRIASYTQQTYWEQAELLNNDSSG